MNTKKTAITNTTTKNAISKKYLQAFTNTYNNLLEEILLYGSISPQTLRIVMETETFINYVSAIKTLIKYLMNDNTLGHHHKKMASGSIMSEYDSSSIQSMVISLRESSCWHYDRIEVTSHDESGTDSSYLFETDELLTELLEKIVVRELKDCYYINKKNAIVAFNCIKRSVHNHLCDLCKKNTSIEVPLSLDACSENHEKNSSCAIRSLIDESIYIEKDAIIKEAFEFAKKTLIHKNISMLLSTNKSHRMIAYVNQVAGRSNKLLYEDIHSLGYNGTIRKLVNILLTYDIDISYLQTESITWKKASIDVTQHNVETWSNHARTQIQNALSVQDISLDDVMNQSVEHMIYHLHR